MSCECFERPEVIACEEDEDEVLVKVSKATGPRVNYFDTLFY